MQLTAMAKAFKRVLDRVRPLSGFLITPGEKALEPSLGQCCIRQPGERIEEQSSMPLYDIIAHCTHCGDEHPVLMRVDLVNGPSIRQRVADVFPDRVLPPQLQAVKRHTALCLKSGKKYHLSD